MEVKEKRSDLKNIRRRLSAKRLASLLLAAVFAVMGVMTSLAGPAGDSGT